MNIMFRSALSIVSAVILSVTVQAAQLGAGAFSVGVAKGDVTYRLANSETFIAAPAGTALPEGATLKTGANSSVTVVFSTGSVATIGANSVVEVSKFQQEPFTGTLTQGFEPSVSDTQLALVEGEVISNVAKLRKGSKYEVTSPVGAAGVRGTVFYVKYDKASGAGIFEVASGSIVLTLKDGSTVTVRAGYGWDSRNPTVTYPLTVKRVNELLDLANAETEDNIFVRGPGAFTPTVPNTDLIGVSIN